MRYILSVIGFLVIIAMLQGVLLYFAISSKTGLIEEQGYEKGLVYQKVIDKMTNAEQSGFKPQLSQFKFDNKTVLKIVLNSKTEHSLPKELQLLALYPADETMDFEALAKPCGENNFCVSLKKRLRGLWFIELSFVEEKTKKELLWKLREVF